ncbi:zeaxanthin epoxidase chloroplastic [Fusarium circinatum]|uniref:Zeaxanthin epoxidase chloroplastic n=1 Tax=Fusarium circinatum TaxID=48490 RepID=A0A8H5WJC6_FUSCI|nr:zeaxanthin epoxidase chloroplastic [Fusarium circinatum]
MIPTKDQPVLIIGAGISGLLLAQSLSRHGIPFRVFERDTDIETRGVGWGLTLLWTLPVLKDLLPKHLFDRLPEAYVDREAVTQGLSSSFPFFDLSTGELKASVPKAPEAERVRVARQGLRALLATGIDIEWGKGVAGVVSTDDSVTASFEDGSSVTGSLLVACDGSHSRVRRSMFPEWKLQDIPVRMLGIKMELSPPQIKPIRDLDPYFFHSTNSKNDSFVYFSVLDAPGNHSDTDRPYIGQLCISWPYREGLLNRPSPIEIPDTPEEKYKLVQELTSTWAECFHPLASAVSMESEMKGLKIQDLTPPKDFHTSGRAVLMGDALHAMAMYRGEGANHVIFDVQDFVERVVPTLDGDGDIRSALDQYEQAVLSRTRPAVLASRRACLDAHNWKRISKTSPLLTKRMPYIEFEETEEVEVTHRL